MRMIQLEAKVNWNQIVYSCLIVLSLILFLMLFSTRPILTWSLEVMLSGATIIMTASLLAPDREPVLELFLSYPGTIRKIWLTRILLVLCSVSMLGLILLVLSTFPYWINQEILNRLKTFPFFSFLPIGKGVLVFLSPVIFFAGLSSFFVIRSGNMTLTLLLSGSCWAMSLLCWMTLMDWEYYIYLFPFITSYIPNSDAWVSNRCMLLFMGIAFLALALIMPINREKLSMAGKK